MMKKQIVTLLLPLSLLALPALSVAATDTDPLFATASVSAKCNIVSTTNVAFGSVDPTTNGNYDGVGSIKTHCSKGTPQFLFITPTVAGVLKMTSPTTNDSIIYGIYSDEARTTAFPSAVSSTKTPHSGTATITSIYGRVVVSNTQNNTIAAASDYTQSLTATIEW
jgi:spore coat protein U-like protein